jgi:hypothetical protein
MIIKPALQKILKGILYLEEKESQSQTLERVNTQERENFMRGIEEHRIRKESNMFHSVNQQTSKMNKSERKEAVVLR